MQLKINKEQILGPLTRVNTVVERRPTIPFLSHVLMKTEENGISLTGSNIEIEVVETIPGIQVEEGELLFPGKSMLEFCRWQPENTELLFETGEEGLVIQALKTESNSNESIFKTQTYQSQDFPETELAEWDIEFELDTYQLYDVMHKTAFSMGQKDVRFYLNAMLFEIDDNTLRTVTTDGHRLSTTETTVNTGANGTKIRSIVSRKAVIALMQLLSNAEKSATLSLNSSHVRLVTKNVRFTAKLLEGTFPDWTAAIPTSLTRTVVADRIQLLNKLKMVKNSLADEADSTGRIATTLEIADNKIGFKGKNIMQEVISAVDIELEGEKLVCSLDSGYLIDVLEATATEKVQFKFKNAESACMIRPEDDESTMYLIMLLT